MTGEVLKRGGLAIFFAHKQHGDEGREQRAHRGQRDDRRAVGELRRPHRFKAGLLSLTRRTAALPCPTVFAAHALCLTWAFEFEDQPPFAGFRELATNGIDKPVLNAFRMFGMLGSERVEAASSGALATEDVVRNGVREQPDVGVTAARGDRRLEVMVWNYHDDDIPAVETSIDLNVDGLPAAVRHVVFEHFRIDRVHSNAFTTWKEMGSPESLSSEQRERLERDGQLQLLDSPRSVPVENGKMHLQFALPRQGISLVRVRW